MTPLEIMYKFVTMDIFLQTTGDKCRWKWSKLNAHYDDQRKHNFSPTSSGKAPYKGGKKGSGPLHPEVMDRLAELKGERESHHTPYIRSSFPAVASSSAVEKSTLDDLTEGSQLPTTSPGASCSLDAVTASDVTGGQTPIARRHSGNNRQGCRKTHGTGSAVAKRRIALKEKFQYNLERNIELLEKREVLEVLVKAKEEKAAFRREKLEFLKRKESNKEIRFDKFLKAKARIAKDSPEELKRRNDLIEEYLKRMRTGESI